MKGFKGWRRPTLPDFTPVPSALSGLTSEFGKGSGVYLALWPPGRSNTELDMECGAHVAIVVTGGIRYFDIQRESASHDLISLSVEMPEGAIGIDHVG